MHGNSLSITDERRAPTCRTSSLEPRFCRQARPAWTSPGAASSGALILLEYALPPQPTDD
ncbi:hypothetical protein ACWDR3_11075 [Streptomyces sp. NPDC001002]